jgi:hypothetical protein
LWGSVGLTARSEPAANMKTAKGLEISPGVLSLVDEVIE